MIQRCKLHAPLPPHESVARPRLLEPLAALNPGSVLLIVAPAGYGKTTLVAQWLAAGAPRAAWLSLDGTDTDATRCARYLCAALEPVLPGLKALGRALDARELSGPREIADTLVEELRALDAPAQLVLDDYHALAEDGGARALLTYLVEHLPPMLSLIVTSRSMPAWPCASLRARGKLLELDAEALRFSGPEAATLLKASGQSLSRAALTQLARRTEGWAVGLTLASLLLRQGEDAAALLSRFGGRHHWVADYLVQEVLAGEPEAVREFLLLSAALPSLCDELCAAAGLSTTGVRLRDLHARGLFLYELDAERRWFRYHDLFRELLLDQAAQHHAGRLRDVRVRAAAWLARHDRAEGALDLLLAAGEHMEAAELLERHARARLLGGEYPAVRAWLDAIPEAVRGTRPRLLTLDAWTLPDERRARLAEPLLDRAAELLTDAERRDGGRPGQAHAALGVHDAETRDQLLAEIAMMRSFFARMRRDFDEASRLSSRALELSRGGGIPVRARAATGLAQDAFMSGDWTRARGLLERALDIAKKEGEIVSVIMASGYLIDVLTCAGELDLALRVGEGVGRWIERHKLSRTAMARWQRGVLVTVWLERDQLERAAEAIEPLLDLDHGAPLQRMVVHGWRLLLARARGDLDQADRALDDLDAVRRATNTRYSFGIAEVAAWRADLALRRGHTEGALAWFAAHGEAALATTTFLGEGDREIAVRVEVCAMDPERGAQHALALAEQARGAGRLSRAVCAQVMAAHAMLRRGQQEQAAAILGTAFAHAKAHGFHRALLDALPDPSGLLRFAGEQRIVPEVTRRLIAGLHGPSEGLRVTVDGVSEPLRPRELQMLRLLGEGLKNEEMAARLEIKASTIKVHLRSLYKKLGATSRSRALAISRERGLLA